MKRNLFLVLVLVGFSVTIAGCINGYDDLEVTRFEFVETHEVEEWPDDLVERDSEFNRYEEVPALFTVEGFKVDEDDSVDYEYFVTVRDPEGATYDELDDVPLSHVTDEVDPDWDWIEDSFGPVLTPDEDGWGSGENEIEFRVVDNVDQKEVTFTRNFDVVSNGNSEQESAEAAYMHFLEAIADGDSEEAMEVFHDDRLAEVEDETIEFLIMQLSNAYESVVDVEETDIDTAIGEAMNIEGEQLENRVQEFEELYQEIVDDYDLDGYTTVTYTVITEEGEEMVNADAVFEDDGNWYVWIDQSV